MSENIILVSDTMIKERTVVHGNIDPKLIYPDIKYAQDAYITPLLGTGLFNKLLAMIKDGTITSDITNVNYKYLMDTYVVDALIYFTLSELPETLSFQFWNKGIVRKQGQDTELPTMSDLMVVSARYRKRAEHYASRCRLWLLQNAPQMFPEYLNPGNTIDTIVPEQRAFSMPVWLGDGYDRCDDDNPFCNRGGFNGQPYKS